MSKVFAITQPSIADAELVRSVHYQCFQPYVNITETTVIPVEERDRSVSHENSGIIVFEMTGFLRYENTDSINSKPIEHFTLNWEGL